MPTAVIITGNPKYVRGNRTASRFYDQLHAHLVDKGFDVAFDPGKAYTSPPPADVWIGHSRGSDRLRFAPSGTMTIAMGVPWNPDAINHPEDEAQVGARPGIAHFTLTDEMRARLDARLEPLKQEDQAMPFASRRQQRAMFGGHIPGMTKEDAHRWADETPSIKKLPERAPAEKGKPTLRAKKAAPLVPEPEDKGPGGERAIAISGLLGAGAQFANHGYGIGGNWAQGSQGWGGEGSAGIGALLSGPGHNRGRRALGAAVGDALGARMGGLAGALTGAVAGGSREAMAVGGLVGQSVGKAMGGIAGNKLVDDLTKHEREGEVKHAGAHLAQFEEGLAEVFKIAALGTSAMNPSNVGRLKGMMTTHALKAPGYAASTQAVNPRKNVVSAMNAMKPH